MSPLRLTKLREQGRNRSPFLPKVNISEATASLRGDVLARPSLGAGSVRLRMRQTAVDNGRWSGLRGGRVLGQSKMPEMKKPPKQAAEKRHFCLDLSHKSRLQEKILNQVLKIVKYFLM